MNRLLVLGLIALMAVTGGCQFLESSTGGDPQDQPADYTQAVIDLDSPTGGFTESDEQPAFGEPADFENMGIEPMYNDPLAEDGYVRELEQDQFRYRNARIFRLRALWGQLAMAVMDTVDTDCCAVDWTGGMHLDGGIVIVEKLIAFDQLDYMTRIDRSTIEWVSHTCPSVDGIQVRLIVPPPPADSTSARPDSASAGERPEPTLTIKAGPFSRTFTLDELKDLDILQPVDRCGNGIILRGRELRPDCPTGYLFGKFMSVAPDTIIDPDSGETRGIILARFRGVWMSEHGWAAGYLRGVAGVNSQGEKVFFGKYINLGGRFTGILRGKYGPAPEVDAASATDPARGWFDGEWLGRNAAHLGFCKGDWISDGEGAGYFKGMWGMNCVNIDQ